MKGEGEFAALSQDMKDLSIAIPGGAILAKSMNAMWTAHQVTNAGIIGEGQKKLFALTYVQGEDIVVTSDM